MTDGITENETLEAASADVAAAQVILAEAQDAEAEAKAEVAKATAILDAAIEARDGKPHPHQDQIDRMNYIKRQSEIRAGRFARAAKVREELSDPEALEARAPLDKAMARKTGHGNRGRPKRKADA